MTMLFSATPTRVNPEAKSYQGSTYQLSPKPAKEDDVFFYETSVRKKEILFK